MKRLLSLLAAFGLVVPGWAQETPVYLTGEEQSVQVSLGGWYQHYTRDEVRLSEVSIPLFVAAPLGRTAGVTVRASQASASSNTLASLSGISDVQLGFSYTPALGEGSLVLSLGLNLPSGKRELTTDEFETAVMLSQHYFDFYVPGFGQGFNLAPGIVWARPIGEDVVAGLGVSYQYRGPYRPQAAGGDYDPGDELVLTGGIDYRLRETVNLSLDASYTRYGKDALDEVEVFEQGDKVTLTGQLLAYQGFRAWRLVVRYRSPGRSTFPAVGGAARELRVLPAQLLVRGSYHHPVNRSFAVGALVQGRFLDETVRFDRATLVDLGVLPEFALSRVTRLNGRFVYTLGDFSGFAAGVGLSVVWVP
ncbi:MAG: hypothetical protein KatS3mg043_1417 [Rhodothermaceae bacterium]|nr:MAG: hypothetical protein KatS3mg043_1417 [Rhodothermaceae bacterium]